MDYFKEFLNDIELAELQRFADNPTMSGAVRKALLHCVYYQGTLKKGEMPNAMQNFLLQVASRGSTKSDADVGRDLNIRWEGVNIVESGFKEIDNIKTVPKKTGDKVQPHR